MSSMTLILVRPSGALETKVRIGFFTASSYMKWKQSRTTTCRPWQTWHRDDGASGGKLVTKAGLGRNSGAIHGSRIKKVWRRTPSQTTHDEHDEKELTELNNHVANVRGAFGDDVGKESMSSEPSSCEINDDFVVDEYHADGTDENSTQYNQMFDYGSSLIVKNEAPTHNDNPGGVAEDLYDKSTGSSRSGSGNERYQRRKPVIANAGIDQDNFSHCNLTSEHDEHNQKVTGTNVAVDSGISFEENSNNISTKLSNINDKENGNGPTGSQLSKGVPPVVESKGEADRPRNGTAKSSMQRRSSKGRKKKLSGSETPPVLSFPEEVAPVAATILTDSRIFADSKENLTSTLDSNIGQGKLRRTVSRLKAFDRKTMGSGRRSTNIEDDTSMTDTICVRASISEAERPVQVQGYAIPASTNIEFRNDLQEDVSTIVHPSHFDMNHSNGHIQQTRKGINLLEERPWLLRIERPGDATNLQLATESLGSSGDSAPVAISELQVSEASDRPIPLKLVAELPSKVVKELPLKIAELPVKVAELPVKVADLPDISAKVVEISAVTELSAVVAELPAKVAELPTKIVAETAQILKTQVVEPVVEILPDAVVEQVGAVVEQVATLKTQVTGSMSRVAGQVKQVGQNIVDQVTDGMQDSMVDHSNSIYRLQQQVSSQVDQVSTKVSEQVSEVSSQVLESVSSTAAQVSESVTSTVSEVTESVQSTASQVTESVQFTANKVSSKAAEMSSTIVDFLTNDDEDSDSDDEFETFKTSDSPEFRGVRGLQNFQVLQEDEGIFFVIYDFYIYMLKKPLPQFACGMFAAPVLLSVIFTFLYLPDCQGLALDETARSFFDSETGDVSTGGLTLSWMTLFQLFMFSLSLSTGLQPELAPLSPYTLVLANINALIAQLIFVFLSGAVFARLSQPSQPVRCSKVALICPSLAQRRRRVDYSATKVLMARYVLAGPQPCELVDVKVDFTYKYNTLTRSGSFFRATQSLKLVRSEIAYLNQGMLVRHIIDESSPLYRRTHEMLRREDAIFTLSVVGLERSSMQSVFHVQHYCVCDDDIIWDAEFEDMMLISKKNKRIVDHSKLSLWRPV